LIPGGSIKLVPPGISTLNNSPYAFCEPNYFLSVGFDLLLKSFPFACDVLTWILLYLMTRDRIGGVCGATFGLAFWILPDLRGSKAPVPASR